MAHKIKIIINYIYVRYVQNTAGKVLQSLADILMWPNNQKIRKKRSECAGGL